MKSELRHAQTDTLQELNELAELGRNAKVIFHDLSNHLTALTLSMDNLQACLVRDGKKLLEYSRRSDQTREQMEYVSSMLKSHLAKATVAYFDPAREIEKITQTFKDKAYALGIDISIKTHHVHIFGNKHIFAHIVTNLLSNAIESFSSTQTKRKTPKKISVILKHRDSETILTVADTGCGIPEPLQKKMFDEKFTTKKTGHGIGLFAIKKFVTEEFSGTILFKTSCRGTAMTIRFPELKQS